ncbi:MAG: hypothetical protein ABI718_11235, partial [Acidobacteriota bacterium]
MQTKELHLPPESPQDPDPVSRLTARLLEEGFRPLHEQEEEWQAIGERVYHRSEKVSFVRGETVFVLIDYPELDQRILQQAMEGQSMLFQARRKSDRALSVFQSTTVYVCIVARSESPHTASLGRYISTAGGAVVIPVVIVPEINQVVYPTVEEKVGSVRPRIEYLQYILGERREPVNMHAKT